MKNKLMVFGAVALIIASIAYAGRGKPNFNWETVDPFEGYAGQIQHETTTPSEMPLPSDAQLDVDVGLLDDPVQ